jgi:hypothetical protein
MKQPTGGRVLIWSGGGRTLTAFCDAEEVQCREFATAAYMRRDTFDVPLFGHILASLSLQYGVAVCVS